MRRLRLPLGLVLIANPACGYDFDVEEDHFACESSDDCIDGYVCADHVVIDADATSYCVKEDKAQLGIFLSSPLSEYLPTCDLSDAKVTVSMETDTDGGGDWTSKFQANEGPRDSSEVGTCTGGLTSSHVLWAYCSTPFPATDRPNVAAIWVAAHTRDFVDSDPSTWMVHAWGGGVVDPENPLVQPYPAALDQDRADMAACRAAHRTSCTTTACP